MGEWTADGSKRIEIARRYNNTRYSSASCGRPLAHSPKLCHGYSYTFLGNGDKSCGQKLWRTYPVYTSRNTSCGELSNKYQAVAKSCGGHIQSIPHVIQAVANLSSYSLGSQSASILYGTLRHSFYLILRSQWHTVSGIWQPCEHTELELSSLLALLQFLLVSSERRDSYNCIYCPESELEGETTTALDWSWSASGRLQYPLAL